jgi:hypothetical protein
MAWVSTPGLSCKCAGINAIIVSSLTSLPTYGKDYQKQLHYDRFGLAFDPKVVKQSRTVEPDLNLSTGIATELYWIDDNKTALIDTSEGPFVPTWQASHLCWLVG